MRILTLIPGGISEQILFFPTLEDLKRQYPQATIDVIVEPRAKNAYRVCQYVNEVLMFDFKDRNGLADYINLLGIIRDREYDLALSLSQRWTIGFLLWLNGVPTRAGYKTKTSWFFSNSVAPKPEQYLAFVYHDLLQSLNINIPCPPLKINVPKSDIDWAEAQQARLGIKESGYIAIYDGPSQVGKSAAVEQSYPIPKWQRIVEDIKRKQPDLPVVLLQDSENTEWAKMISAACPELKRIETPDLGKLAATIAGANLLICTDSAPMQLAVAVGTHTVALFGPTDPKKLLPPNDDKYTGIQSMTGQVADIQPEQILEKIWRG